MHIPRLALPLVALCGFAASHTLAADTKPLKELYPGVLIGTTATYGGLSNEGVISSPNKDTFLTILNREFNLGQGTCYPAWDTWTGPKTYDFTKVNAAINYVHGQGMELAMHVLAARSSYYPSWFVNGTYTNAQLEDMLEDYIRAVMQSNDNASKVKYWNVVNECLDSNNHYFTNNVDCVWQQLGYEEDKSGLTGSAKVHTQHPVWIRKAFEYAKKYAAPGSKLELRDYNIEFWQVYKSAAFYQLVRHLLNSGVPVNAVGIQSHLGLNSNYDWSLAKRAVQEFKKLGLEVYLTELDIGDTAKAWSVTKADLQKQYYQNYIQATCEAGVDYICIWGMHDNCNPYWRYDESPLPWDANYAPKPAYYGFAAGLSPAVATQAPSFLAQPVSVTVAPGGQNTLSCTARGQGPLSYQWKKDGVAVSGATASSLTINPLTAAQSGNYTVTVTNGAGSVTSRNALLTVATPEPGRIVNLSVRAVAGRDGNPLTLGFIPEGSAAKQVLIRGGGPALNKYSVPNTLADPRLDVYDGQTLTASNDDWGTEGLASMQSLFGAVGAYGFEEGGKDAAISLKVTGPRSVQINGKNKASGVVLAEVYEIDSKDGAPLVNVSARNYCGSGSDVLIAGFIISGNVPKKLLVRGIGPGLDKYSVPNTLADPKVEIHTVVNGQDVLVASNDNWCEQPDALSLRGVGGAFAIDPGSKDAAMIVTLPPCKDGYTAVVSGVGGTTGEALVEVYSLP